MNAIVIKWMLVIFLMLGSAVGFAYPPTTPLVVFPNIQLNEPPENDPPLQPDPNKEGKDEKKEKKDAKGKAKKA